MIKHLAVIAAISTMACCVSCTSTSSRTTLQPQRTVIAGVVENMPEEAQAIVINYVDPLNGKQEARDLSKTKGHFVFEYDYIFEQDANVRYNAMFIPFFITPGDSVFITIDASRLKEDPDNAITFSGKNAQISSQMGAWTRYYNHFLSTHPFGPDGSASPDAYLNDINAYFTLFGDTLEAYAARTGMDTRLKEWAIIENRFVIANYLDYENEAHIWQVYTDSIFNLYHPGNFRSSYYTYHLSACINALLISDAHLLELFIAKEYPEAIPAIIDELKKKTSAGVVQDVMLYQLVSRIFNEAPELYDAIPELHTAFSQPLFNEKLKTQAKEKLDATHNTPTVKGEKLNGISYLDGDEVVPLPSTALLPYLAEKHKGKVLYIDVWATWCGPCIKEMKHTPELHAHYKDKDVVFINICMESSFHTWVPTIKRLPVEGENYYLNEDASLLFRAENSLSGYPSYIIVDKDRRQHYPAPRPSAKEEVIRRIDGA